MAPLSTLPLRPSTVYLLQQHGILSLSELKQEIVTLKEELSLDDATYREILTALAALSNNTSTVSLLSQTKKAHIITFNRQVDKLLQGGIPIGELTEIAGLPNSGKTQLAMQLCCNSFIPPQFGGTGATRAIYVDSEGSFSAERMLNMATALVSHVKASAKKSSRQVPPHFTSDFILDNTDIYRIHDAPTQHAVLHALEHVVTAQPGVKLVVVDSIAFHQRSASDFLQRTRQLTAQASTLTHLAQSQNLAVVCINQMTTKVGAGASAMVPALGDSWAHAVTNRIILQPNFVLELKKSTRLPPGKAAYRIVEHGFRDAPKDVEQHVVATKRPRVS